MDEAHSIKEEQTAAPETPEDVAILYSWANLPGAKYRDFSASRREYRAQQRARTAEAQREAELAAARQLEQASQHEIEEAQRKVEEAESLAQVAADEDTKRHAAEALRLAEERAEQERLEIQRREESAEELRQRAERAREEMLDARKRAEEQAARYEEADAQYHAQMDLDRDASVPGETTDPYYYAGHVDPAYFAATPGVRTARAARTSTERKQILYPAHSGSEDYDSGALMGHSRNNNNFAPAQGKRRSPSSPLREETIESVPRLRNDGARRSNFRDADDGYFDDGYFEAERPTPEVSSAPERSPRTPLAETRSEVHIRPATLVSDEDPPTYALPARRSPLPQVAPPSSLVPSTDRNGESRSLPRMREVLPQRVAPQLREPPRVSRSLHPADPESAEGVRTEPAFAARQQPVRFENANQRSDENRSSRVFHPEAPRRILPEKREAGVRNPDPAANAGSPGRNTDGRDGGRRPALAPTPRVAEAAFALGRQERTLSLENSDRVSPPVHPEPEDLDDSGAGGGSSVRGSAAQRTPEAVARRRREFGPSTLTRTVRQPRAEDEEPENEVSQQPGSPPPAWLSSERAAVQEPGGLLQTEFTLTSFPGEFGDSGLPLPRAIPRPVHTAGGAGQGYPAVSTAAQHGPAVPVMDDPWRLATGGGVNASDTLQQSRERVASRWFALSGLMGTENREKAEVRTAPSVAPNLCVLSISGGVGKTSIVATLGRALSSLGEKVLLVDTNVHGILPYYFGAREPRPGTVRTFAPPPGSVDAPVVLVSYDADGRGYDEAAKSRVLDDLARRSQNTQRVLLDVGIGSAWLARKLARDNPWIIVPVTPDMNSVLSTQAVERLFQDVTDNEGRPVKPYYVLNQYDATLPLHLDVREVLRQFLGDRLLPTMLHRTPVVSEALAEGMTVIDYAAGTPIAEDYMNLAGWVRRLSHPGAAFPRGPRWSER